MTEENEMSESAYENLPGVLIASAECAPLVKIGGLADVVGALPKYLGELGIDARVIMPFHRQIKDRYAAQAEHLCDFHVGLGWRSQYVGVEKLVLDGVTYYFIDNEFYFGGPVYCGGEFEGEQYAFFTRATLEAIPCLDFEPGILHCNDWHTAMMPLLVKTQYQGAMQGGLRTVLTIHNLHFQGQFSHEFDRDLLGVDDSLATPDFVGHYGCDNMLKAGIVFADKVSTVSPTYAQEICTPELGESLDGVLRSRGSDLSGILNGIDREIWNPSDDAALPARFSAKSAWRKRLVKAALLEELGLDPIGEGEDVPLIGMVGRLTPQKGIDLLCPVLDDIMARNVRMVVLGSGDADLENFLRDGENRYKGRLCSYIGYNGDLSHRIYAASDLFLMPSAFEPCGISQMIALAYGTLPIVRETGGLKDTVVPYNRYTGEGTGFSFANYDAYEMLGCIDYALETWHDKPARKRLIQQAMACDFGFGRCARAYADLYLTL
ncbi:glycogen/starch synthase, ADP-glucose type [Slackia heliotrinireducens DSM 20476]|uniref:Glycogen synthase n=2 Tax=Slackia TaxID=84108 RepID=C7N738_SLAHD|nr:glycogen/starch synthase, ADP-glucose type [Slackia heliotrinireducens DSM 20476]